MAEDKAKQELVKAVGVLVFKHGIPAALKIIKTWQVEDPTVADIEALRDMVPPAESYFDED
jgi:hypothetical protein